jgi:hypothetical protein
MDAHTHTHTLRTTDLAAQATRQERDAHDIRQHTSAYVSIRSVYVT